MNNLIFYELIFERKPLKTSLKLKFANKYVNRKNQASNVYDSLQHFNSKLEQKHLFHSSKLFVLKFNNVIKKKKKKNKVKREKE